MASMGIRQADLLGLVTGTLAAYPFPNTFDTFNLARYPMLDLAMRRKRSTGGGKTINFFINKSGQGNFRWTRPYTKDATRANDNFIEGAVKMCFWDTHYTFDRKEEELNRGPARLVNLVEERRIFELKATAEAIEYAMMGAPDDSNDDRKPNGFPFLFAPRAGAAPAAGFNGSRARFGTHSTTTNVSTTTVQGIDRAAAGNENMRNWRDVYTKCDQPWLKKFRSAMMDVRITPPMNLTSEARGAMMADGSVVRAYLPKEAMLQVLETLDSKNTNWGRNINGTAGQSPFDAVFNNVEFVHCPALDPIDTNDTNFYRTTLQPIYCIDHSQCYTHVLGDRWMAEREPAADPTSHDGVVVWMDGSMQNVVPNIKYAGFVFHKAFTDSSGE